MAALTTAAAVANAAIQLIGGNNNQGPLTGAPPTFDGSTLGLAAGTVYNEVVQACGRGFGYDFARNMAALAETGNPPRQGWAFEYAYPTNGIQVRQIMPATGGDPNNPLPINWLEGNVSVAGTPAKIIWCNVAGAQAEISNTPPESLWDALFQETVIRELASKLAIAGFGKPDLMRELHEMAGETASISVTRDS